MVDGKTYVFAIHTKEHNSDYNEGVRITQSKFDQIHTFIASGK